MDKEEKKEPVVKTVQKQKKAEYKYIRTWATTSKTYNVGDDCLETNSKVIEFLTAKKIIKKNGNNS